MPLAEVVVNVQTGRIIAKYRRRASSICSNSDITSRRAPIMIVTAFDRGERHGVAQHAGTDRVALAMVGLKQAIRRYTQEPLGRASIPDSPHPGYRC